MHQPVPDRIHAKIRKCLALAQDGRGDPTTAETALRQAVVLMKQYGIDPPTTGAGCQPAPIVVDWSVRTSAEAAAAGLRRSVLCSDGWYVPEDPRGRP